MGESAQRGYDEAEQEAFRALPLRDRLKANALSVATICATVAIAAVLVAWVL
jgi:hypothetical protein